MNHAEEFCVNVECSLTPGFDLSKQNVVELSQNVLSRNEKIARIKDWVNIQTSIPNEEYFDVLDSDSENVLEEPKSSKRKLSDCDSDDSSKEYPVARKEGKVSLIVYMDCEWIGCRYNTTDSAVFQKHVKSHIPELIIKSYEDGRSVYVCLWDLCNYETSDNKEITRHINYHTYHTRIKSMGRAVRDQYFIKDCSADSAQRNKLPVILTDFACKWVGCSQTFNCIQNFFDHVKSHSLGTEDGTNVFLCGWFGCPHRTNKISSILGHMHVHTNEKRVACCNCGATFATNTKFRDHCERQTTAGTEFKCTVCSKYFYNERLLRNHMRYHNKSFKCQFCDVLVTTPAVLGRHIQSCHIGEKYYKCHLCSFACKRESDLQGHVNRHTNTAKEWPRYKKGRIYACHICDREYTRGNALSQHLCKKHGHCTPAGAVRFKYDQSEDGVFRLSAPHGDLPPMVMIPDERPKKKKKKILEAENYKLIEHTSGNDEEPPSFVVLPANHDSTNLEEILTVQGTSLNDKSENNENKQIVSAVAPVKKKIACHKRKKKVIKRENIDEEIGEPLYSTLSIEYHKVEDDFGVEDKSKNIPLFADLGNKSNTLSQIKNIEISIADVDYHGNIVKTEVLESQELILD